MGGLRRTGVELLHNMFKIKGVDAQASVEHVRASDELGEHDSARRLLDGFGEDVLEGQEVEAVLHGAVEEEVDDAEESESGRERREGSGECLSPCVRPYGTA
jgi:hypothetical protein